VWSRIDSSRGRQDILWGLPSDLVGTPLGRLVDELLADAPRAAPGQSCEIDLVVAPSRISCSRPAECRLLLATRGHHPPRNQRRRADRVITVDATDRDALAGVLDEVG